MTTKTGSDSNGNCQVWCVHRSCQENWNDATAIIKYGLLCVAALYHIGQIVQKASRLLKSYWLTVRKQNDVTFFSDTRSWEELFWFYRKLSLNISYNAFSFSLNLKDLHRNLFNTGNVQSHQFQMNVETYPPQKNKSLITWCNRLKLGRSYNSYFYEYCRITVNMHWGFFCLWVSESWQLSAGTGITCVLKNKHFVLDTYWLKAFKTSMSTFC